MPRRRYPTDLTDRQWTILGPLVPAPKPGGRPAKHARREIVDAMLYVLRGGISWRSLPHEDPPWQTVYAYCRQWRDDGTWERVNQALRERLRLKLGRDPQPSAAIIDSQSVRTTEKGGSAATTAGRREAAASGICWWIPRACGSRAWSMPPTWRTGMGRGWSSLASPPDARG